MSRLCGADIIYAGSPNWARYEQEPGDIINSFEKIYYTHQVLSKEFRDAEHIKNTIPTITNDQHPSRIELITALFRKNFNNYYKYGN